MRLFATDDKPVPPSYSLEVRPISLEDDFNAKKAAWEKQSRRLTELLGVFDAEKLSCDPSRYASLKDQIEQLAEVVASLKTAMDEAELKYAESVFAERKHQAEAAAQEKRKELTSQLTILDTEISSLDIAYRQIPEQLTRLQMHRSQILNQLATL